MALNKEQKAKLKDIQTAAEVHKVNAEELRDDLQSVFDGKSERWQGGEAGTKAQENIEAVESLIDKLEEVVGDIGDIIK